MADTATCAGCDTENPAAARFCMGCGDSLEVPCVACGTALPPGAHFCFSCGHELQEGATADEAGQSAMSVASGIADELRAITAAAGERRTITMMFCDVKDSTRTAERMDPESWSDIMRTAMDCFVAPVERYGGTVARLLGDAILAYFGAPEAHEDDPQRAILAGLEILECTADLCRQVQAQHGTDFNVRVGINTGLVVVGDLGSDTRSEYAALGDAANVAARMEQTAAPGTVRIAGPTHRLVAPLFDVEDVGPIEVKGREAPVAAYRVLRARGRPGQVRGIEGLTSPMVGRAAELDRLLAVADGVVAGSGRIVSVMGEAGLGKSRLVAEFRARAEPDHGVRWIAGQCHSYEDTTPYAPFLVLLRDLFDLPVVAAAGDQAEQVTARVVELLGDEGRNHAPYLCSVLGLPLAPDDQHLLSLLEPGMLREKVFEAVVAVLGALASREPLVVELEDLHWADPTSIDLVERLLGLTERGRLLLLLLFRPRRHEPSWSIHEAAMRGFAQRHEVVALRPLGDDDAASLVANLLRVEGLSPQVRRTILAKSEGNPFFVEEVIRSLLDAGIVVREGERFVATEEISDVAVPDTLAAVLATRLDKLDPAARAVVQIAAVLGREFPVAMLRELSDPTVDLAAVVHDLQQRELVVERRSSPEVVLAFKHALTRDTAYETLLRSVRRDLHRLVGTLVEERHPDRVFELARHFAEAGEPARAVPYLVQAGEAAFAAFARSDAADYFRRALEQWDPALGLDLADARRAYEGLGNAQMYLGEMGASEATFREMLAFSREHGDPIGEISALNKAGMVLLMTGDPEPAEASLLEARQLAEAAGHQPGLAEFHVGFCVLNVSQGRLDDAERHLGEAAEVCFTLDPHHRNFGLLHYSESIVYQTRFEEARPAIMRARQQAELDDDYAHLAGSWYAEALLELYCGDPERANELATTGLELAERVASQEMIGQTSFALGATCLLLGDLDSARVHLQRTVAIDDAGGPGWVAPMAHAGLAAVAQWLEGPGSTTTRRHLERAQERAAGPMGSVVSTGVWAASAVGHLLDGQLEDAERSIDRARRAPSALTHLVAPELLICGGGVALARGDSGRAGALFAEALELVDASGMGLYRGRALLGTALVAAAAGNRERARTLLEESEEDTVRRRLRMDTVLVRRTASQVFTDLGMDPDADAARTRLADGIADVAARIEDHELRRDFLATHALVG